MQITGSQMDTQAVVLVFRRPLELPASKRSHPVGKWAMDTLLPWGEPRKEQAALRGPEGVTEREGKPW